MQVSAGSNEKSQPSTAPPGKMKRTPVTNISIANPRMFEPCVDSPTFR
jgi:hypothetical protein